MKKAEALYYYKRYSTEYENAKANRNRANEFANVSRAEYNSVSNELHSTSSRRKNLEKRLEEVKQILSLFAGLVSDCIGTANKELSAVDETYRSTILCSGTAAADIKSAFLVQSVSGDANSSNAYNSCVAEKTRLENGIEALRVQINALSNRMEQINSDISRYSSIAGISQQEMNRFGGLANFYAQQYRMAGDS